MLRTSLFDAVKYELAEIGELYRIRWDVKKVYKMYKAPVQVKTFSGRTAIAFRQDIYAQTMMMILYAVLAFTIEERIVKGYTPH